MTFPSDKLRLLAPWLLIPVLAFAWLWFFRSNGFTGGDSEQWEREIFGGLWFRKRQMLSFATFQLAFQVLHPALEWTAHLAINLVSCLAGAIAALLMWRLFHGRKYQWWEFSIMATGGFTALFYGHIETYAQPAAVFLLHLLAIKRTCQGRWPLWTITATFSLMMWFHLLILFAAPALVIVLAREIWLRKPTGWDLGWAALGLLGGLVCWTLINVGEVGYGELVESNFSIPLGDLIWRPWLAFVHYHIPTKVAFAWFNGGITALLVIWVAWRVLAIVPHQRFSVYLLLYLLCFVGKTLIWNPDAGMSDWDLFSFPFILTTLLVALHVMNMPGRAVLVGLVLATQVSLLLTRPIHWAEPHRRGLASFHLEIRNSPSPVILVLLNDRLGMGRTNGFRTIQEGAHYVRIIIPGEEHIFRVFRVEGGEEFVLVIDGRDIQLLDKRRQMEL